MTETGTENETPEVAENETKKSDLMLKVTTAIVAVALIAVVSLLWLNFRKDSSNVKEVALGEVEDGQVLGASVEDPNYLSNLATTLKADGFILYGSSSDSGTKKQKEIFGQAFSFIDYVECDPGTDNSNPQECAAKGIDQYPTWVRGDQKFPGYKSLIGIEGLLESTF